ncbi:MAG: hypothetical protein RTU63_08675 [Candidatus Thorarchaeota archaeon]
MTSAGQSPKLQGFLSNITLLYGKSGTDYDKLSFDTGDILRARK